MAQPVGIIGAMDVEIETVLDSMETIEAQEHGAMRFYTGTLSGVEVVVARCHAGKVNSALCAQVMIDFFRPRLVINIGVAGGVGPNVHIGDAVIASACVQYDYDITAVGEPLACIELPNGEGSEFCKEFPCDEAISQKLASEAKKLYEGTVHMGVVATGDKFVGDPQFGSWLHATFGALACEMEGCSILQACRLNRVPCAVLRSISDNANDDAKTDFPTFARNSAHKAQRLLSAVIPLL